MKRKFLSIAVFAALVLAGMGLTSCSDDDDKKDNGGDGNSVISFENVTVLKDFVQSGTFMKQGESPQILPGESVSIRFYAGKGQALMFATMYSYSNDIFFAPDNPGIRLYKSDGTPKTGDVSSEVFLWDNGTRINQKPGPDVEHPGVADNGNVNMILGTDAQGNQYLTASELMELSLAYDKNSSEFTLTIKNTSGGTMNETPFSPGVWVVSNVLDGELEDDDPFFEAGDKSSAELTTLAETGNQQALATLVERETGIITTLSPVLVVIYTGDVNPIYQLNQKDAGLGLKELAQTGNVTKLRTSLAAMTNVKYTYVAGNEPVKPGEKVETAFKALKDCNIAYVTMFGYSNDWFYANNSVISADYLGDVTGKTVLLDDGTALSQYPGAGNAQAIFTGVQIPESKVITTVGNTFPVPALNRMIKVTIR